jgi:hypothetical protein
VTDDVYIFLYPDSGMVERVDYTVTDVVSTLVEKHHAKCAPFDMFTTTKGSQCGTPVQIGVGGLLIAATYHVEAEIEFQEGTPAVTVSADFSVAAFAG